MFVIAPLLQYTSAHFSWITFMCSTAQTGDECAVQSLSAHWASRTTDWPADCGNQHQ